MGKESSAKHNEREFHENRVEFVCYVNLAARVSVSPLNTLPLQGPKTYSNQGFSANPQGKSEGQSHKMNANKQATYATRFHVAVTSQVDVHISGEGFSS